MDQLDTAIKAANGDTPVPMKQWGVVISSTGRQAACVLPVDVTDGEIAEFCGWLLSMVLNTVRQDRAKRPTLYVAKGRVTQ